VLIVLVAGPFLELTKASWPECCFRDVMVDYEEDADDEDEPILHPVNFVSMGQC
jgi:hypothetical protein